MFGSNNKKSVSNLFASAGKAFAKSTVGINPVGVALSSVAIMSDAIVEAEKAEDRRRREAERKASAARSTYSAGFSNGFGSGYNAAKREQKKAEEPKYNSSAVTSSLSKNYMREFIRSFGFVDNEAYRKIKGASMLNEEGYKTGVFKAWRTGDTTYRLVTRGNGWKLYVTVVDGFGYMVLTGDVIDDIISVASERGDRFEAHLNYEVGHNPAISGVAKSAYQTMQIFF